MTTKPMFQVTVPGTSKKLRHPEIDKLAEGVLGSGEERLKAERVQEKLRALPGWQLAVDGRGVHRVWDFADARVASAHAGFVNELAGAEGRAAEITLTGARVRVLLRNRRRGTVPAALLEFAKVLG